MRRGGRPAAPSVLATAAKLITAQHSLAPPPPSPSLSGGGGVIHRPSKRVGHIFREWNRERRKRSWGRGGRGGRKENRDFQLNVRLLPDRPAAAAVVPFCRQKSRRRRRKKRLQQTNCRHFGAKKGNGKTDATGHSLQRRIDYLSQKNIF